MAPATFSINQAILSDDKREACRIISASVVATDTVRRSACRLVNDRHLARVPFWIPEASTVAALATTKYI